MAKIVRKPNALDRAFMAAPLDWKTSKPAASDSASAFLARANTQNRSGTTQAQNQNAKVETK